MRIVCPHCHRSFRSGRGLSTHLTRIHHNRPVHSPAPEEGSPDLQEIPVNERTSTPLAYATNDDPATENKLPSLMMRPTRIIQHPGSAGLPIRASDRPSHVCPNWHPWAPFRTAKDYELAYEFWRDGSTKSHIDHILEKGLDGDATTFQSSREIRELSILANKYYGLPLFERPGLTNVKPGKPVRHWTTWRDFSHPSIGTVYYRDVFECVKLLLRHPPFTDHMHYAPIQLFNDEGERIFGDIHTADWWWSTQSTLPPQSTIVPIICASDKTHLTNFSGDKYLWPLYMTIGNIDKELRREKSSLAWICIGMAYCRSPYTCAPPIHGTPRPTPRPSMLRSTNSPVLSHAEWLGCGLP
ncbi:hypothetical protein BDZ91DRAFT_756744 [Kalaharituber pfeilii]|nr:hypothetical protein BDZ91DRAFT_756744 [Kalaharituber pfeilii]